MFLSLPISLHPYPGPSLVLLQASIRLDICSRPAAFRPPPYLACCPGREAWGLRGCPLSLSLSPEG